MGTALGIESYALGGEKSSGKKPTTPIDYPHTRAGLHAQVLESTQLGHRVREGACLTLPYNTIDSNEEYDLIVVGAGLAGGGICLSPRAQGRSALPHFG